MAEKQHSKFVTVALIILAVGFGAGFFTFLPDIINPEYGFTGFILEMLFAISPGIVLLIIALATRGRSRRHREPSLSDDPVYQEYIAIPPDKRPPYEEFASTRKKAAFSASFSSPAIRNQSIRKKTFVFTNKLSRYSFDEVSKIVSLRGGFVRTSLSGKTDFLVQTIAGDLDNYLHRNAIHMQARGSHIKIIDEFTFYQMLKNDN